MAAQELLNLFDSLWFGQETLTHIKMADQEQNPDLEIQEQLQKPDLSRLPTLHVRSLSDQSLLSTATSSLDSFSPNSVLPSTPKQLQTILSGKVMKEELKIEVPQKKMVVDMVDPRATASRRSGTRKKKQLSKSLSELEFDELKGFMDLGFVFSEEDKDSSLVSIIPGLQRFGSREEHKVEQKLNKVHDHENHVAVSRPYLSEAWEVMEKKEKEKALMINFRIPSLVNEIDMKDHLKFWAHSVASAVR